MSELLPDRDYRTLWHVACKDLEQLYDELQDKNGLINRLKHELQSVEYALSDVRINNTMTAADVAHEMRCELDALREQEPVGEVVLFGSELKEVAWRAGKMPQVGTKLYAALKPG